MILWFDFTYYVAPCRTGVLMSSGIVLCNINSFLTYEYHFYSGGKATKQTPYFNLDAWYWKTSVTQSVHDSKNWLRMQGKPALQLNKLCNNAAWKTRNNGEKSNTKRKNRKVLAPIFWPSGFSYEVMLLFNAFANIAQIVIASFMMLSASC